MVPSSTEYFWIKRELRRQKGLPDPPLEFILCAMQVIETAISLSLEASHQNIGESPL